MMRKWLEEAEAQGIIRPGMNLKEVANFIVVAMNGCAPLYAASRDAAILGQTISQLHTYLNQLRR